MNFVALPSQLAYIKNAIYIAMVIEKIIIVQPSDPIQQYRGCRNIQKDIVINKLTQILSYLRAAGSRGKKKKKDKLIPQLPHPKIEPTEAPTKVGICANH